MPETRSNPSTAPAASAPAASAPLLGHRACQPYATRSHRSSARLLGWSLLLVLLSAIPACRSAASRYAADTEDTAVMLDRAWRDVTKDSTYLGERYVAEWLARYEHDEGHPHERARLATSLIRVGETRRALAIFDDLLIRLGPEREPELYERVRRQRAVAWLRLAEQENCLAHHNADSCVFPIVADARHTMAPEGARRADAAWSELLAERPDDLQARWMLEIAGAALGPDAVPGTRAPVTPPIDPTVADLPALRDIADSAGELGVAECSGGCVLDDFDGDGWIDVMTSVAYPVDDPAGRMRLFRNRGDGTFEDVSERAGLSRVLGGLNLAQADYDNDGDLDVLVLRGAWLQEDGQWPNTLLRNDGSGRFEDVTVAAGLLSLQPTQVGCWADYDNDGHLDLFIGNETGIPVRMKDAMHQWFADTMLGVVNAFSPLVGGHLYHNDGDGTFTEVTASSGLELDGWIKGASWGDIDNDGLADLYVAIWGDPNRLFRNLGNGRFEDVADTAGVDDHLLSFATWFFDADNDGDEDLFVAGFPYPELVWPEHGWPLEFRWSPDAELADFLGEPRREQKWNAWPALYENRGDGTFVDATERVGLDATMSIMGANHGDVDGDGFHDILLGTGAPNMGYLVPNRLFLSRPNGDGTGRRYVDASVPLRFAHLQKGHSIGLADLDHDDDQDIYSVLGGAYPGDVFPNALLENPGFGNGMITFDLVGGAGSNRKAVGARLRLVVEDGDGTKRTIARRVDSGGSFGASSLRQEIGIGHARRIVALTIVWPDAARTVQVVRGDARGGPLVVGGRYRIRQGEQPTTSTTGGPAGSPEPGADAGDSPKTTRPATTRPVSTSPRPR